MTPVPEADLRAWLGEIGWRSNGESAGYVPKSSGTWMGMSVSAHSLTVLAT